MASVDVANINTTQDELDVLRSEMAATNRLRQAIAQGGYPDIHVWFAREHSDKLVNALISGGRLEHEQRTEVSNLIDTASKEEIQAILLILKKRDEPQ